MRDIALSKTLQVDAAEAGLKESEGGSKFQIASSDGQKVFFTNEHKLTKDATAKAGAADLYECEIEVSEANRRCKLKDLSVDPHPNEAANVQGAVLGAGEDGRLVYFVSKGALGRRKRRRRSQRREYVRTRLKASA